MRAADAAGAGRPPAIAVTSPFHEVLVRDVAASVPSPLRRHVEQAASVSELNDWLGAAAMYRWVGRDAFQRQVFLEALDGDPRRAGFALARAVAARMDPPERSAEWRRVDRQGLLLQFALVALCLLVRALVVVWVTGPWPWLAPVAPWTAVSSLLDWPLIAGRGLGGPPWLEAGALPIDGVRLMAVGFAIALWHLFELGVVAAYLERVRGWPARQAGLPVPRAWRLDTFHVAWCLQSGALGVIAMVRVAEGVLRLGSLGSSPPDISAIAGAVALGVLLAIGIGAIRKASRAGVS